MRRFEGSRFLFVSWAFQVWAGRPRPPWPATATYNALENSVSNDAKRLSQNSEKGEGGGGALATKLSYLLPLSLSLSLSLFPPTTFLVPSFNVQMIFFIASAGNKLKSERARKEADAERANETRCDIKKSF